MFLVLTFFLNAAMNFLVILVIARLLGPQEWRVPLGLNHPSDKNAPRFKMLEHDLTAKPLTLLRIML